MNSARSHRPLVVINVVGLTWDMLGPQTPHLNALMQTGFGRPMQTVLPAVTCTVQASMLTGLNPAEHGIVANGWYFRDLSEIMFWKQSNHLIEGERVFQTAKLRDAQHSTAKMFWWYNMYSSADWSVTPRPIYPADGRKVLDVYAHPPGLRDELVGELAKLGADRADLSRFVELMETLDYESFSGTISGSTFEQQVTDVEHVLERFDTSLEGV